VSNCTCGHSLAGPDKSAQHANPGARRRMYDARRFSDPWNSCRHQNAVRSYLMGQCFSRTGQRRSD
jgi:hypothetical protein